MARNQAAAALELARAWQEEIDTEVVNRADIARREGLSRARVTQVMALLKLPEDVQERLVAGDEVWSIRRALTEVRRQHT